jgi:hypothetical protein
MINADFDVDLPSTFIDLSPSVYTAHCPVPVLSSLDTRLTFSREFIGRYRPVGLGRSKRRGPTNGPLTLFLFGLRNRLTAKVGTHRGPARDLLNQMIGPDCLVSFRVWIPCRKVFQSARLPYHQNAQTRLWPANAFDPGQIRLCATCGVGRCDAKSRKMRWNSHGPKDASARYINHLSLLFR